MNAIPTAEAFSKNYSRLRSAMALNDLSDFAIEFAKLHVEAALKEASDKAMLKVNNNEEYRDIEEGDDLVEYYECGSDTVSISVNSILNAYPLTNIK